MKFTPGLAAVLILAGCATHPVADRDAEQVTAPEFVQTSAGDTVIIITRDRGLSGAAGTAHILIDGREAIGLRPSQQARLYVAAGDHVVSVANGMKEVQAAAETITNPARERRFRVGVGLGTFQLFPQ